MILAHPKVARKLAEYRDERAAITRAAEKLRRVPLEQAADGVAKAADAIRARTINVFFSYKTTDRDTAAAVVGALRSSGGLNITFAEDFRETTVGMEFLAEIERGVDNANLFILLLPDPQEDYDWPLFETGRFTGRMVPGDRLVCLHHPHVSVPDQIKHFQSVSATEDDVRGFLVSLFRNDDFVPGLKKVGQFAWVDEMTTRICEAVLSRGSPERLRYFDEHVVFEVDAPGELLSLHYPDDPELVALKAAIGFEGMPALDGSAALDAAITDRNLEILSRARIRDATRGVLHILGKKNSGPLPSTWGELTSRVPTRGPSAHWVKELCDALRSIAAGDDFRRIYATVREVGPGGSRVFRPVLVASGERDYARPTVFHLSLLPDVSAMQITHLPDGLSAVLTSLRLAHRFLWEVAEKVRITEPGALDIDEIRGALERVVEEAGSSGLLNPGLLVPAFESEADRQTVSAMYKRWEHLYNDAGTGELNIAFAERDEAAVRKVMDELLETNRVFLQIVIRQLNIGADQARPA